MLTGKSCPTGLTWCSGTSSAVPPPSRRSTSSIPPPIPPPSIGTSRDSGTLNLKAFSPVDYSQLEERYSIFIIALHVSFGRHGEIFVCVDYECVDLLCVLKLHKIATRQREVLDSRLPFCFSSRPSLRGFGLNKR